MDLNNAFHLALCYDIEAGLLDEYEDNPALTDALCIVALDNAIIAVKQLSGFARNESVRKHQAIDGIVAYIVALAREHVGKESGLTLKEFVSIINKVKSSVVRHSADGPYAYFEFIRNYV